MVLHLPFSGKVNLCFAHRTITLLRSYYMTTHLSGKFHDPGPNMTCLEAQSRACPQTIGQGGKQASQGSSRDRFGNGHAQQGA